ncbi:hypothetical protein P3447_09160 [Vibrio parahaemolyticus]|nr:hypothetical protein [Vibrio parahaemolyticus]
MKTVLVTVGVLLAATAINLLLFRVLFKHLEQYKRTPWLSMLHEIAHTTLAFGIIGLCYSLFAGFEEDMIWALSFIYWLTGLGTFSLISLQLAHIYKQQKNTTK